LPRYIIEEVNRHIPVKKVWSIDEMECELIGRERGRAYEIGLAIQDGLRRNIGPYVTPSIGLAPNQFLAKVAAELEKPNGFVMLRREDLPGPLLRLNVERPPTKRRMFGHSRVLSGEFKDPKRAIDCLRLLTVKAANRLRRENYTAGAMTVSFKDQEKRRW